MKRKEFALAIALTMGAALCLLSSHAAAQEATVPELKVGDRWKFKVTDQANPASDFEWEIQETGKDEIKLMSRAKSQVSWTLTPEGNFVSSSSGAMNKPHNQRYAFPLKVGKTWSVHFDWTNQAGKGTTKGERKVAAFEKVTVPAGTFEAFRIESSNYFNYESAVGTMRASSRGSEDVVEWYAPSVKALVKRTRYAKTGSNVVTENSTWELVEFKLN